ncbi:MAG: serine protease [Actinomycetota bacterium]
MGEPMVDSPWRPLRVAAAATVGICLVLGIVLSRLTDTASSTDAASSPAPVADAPEIVEPPVADVLGAVETRSGDLTPASVDHLVIVVVSVTTCGERAAGTGVLVAENTILTAAHTVGDAGLVRVAHGTQILTGEVAGVFADGRDLAVITLQAPLTEPIAAASMPADGSAITIVGFPEGGARSSVVGAPVEVPDLARRLFDGPLAAVDATTRAGMSGGPAIDGDGNLVGLLVGAQPETGTAVLASIDDVASALQTPLTEGRCQATA